MKQNPECCRVDAVVTVDSKGQMVLPKDIREKAGIKPEDKLALIGCERDGKICCIILVKSEAFGASIKTSIGPLLEGTFK